MEYSAIIARSSFASSCRGGSVVVPCVLLMPVLGNHLRDGQSISPTQACLCARPPSGDAASAEQLIVGVQVRRVAGACGGLQAGPIDHGDFAPVIADEATPLQLAGGAGDADAANPHHVGQ